MKRLKKHIHFLLTFSFLGIVVFSFFYQTSFVHARHIEERQVIVAHLEVLTQEVEKLRVLLAVATAQERFSPSFRFQQNLFRGVRNQDVTNLQELLKGLPNIYPEGLVTGFYGELTEKAVSRFQAHYDISPIGMVGPETRLRLNTLLASRRMAEEGTVGNINGRVAEVSESTVVRPEETKETQSFVPDISLLERDIQEAVNKERARYGLRSLAWDSAVADVARAHSVDQAKDNVNITSPDFFCQYLLIRHEGFAEGFTPKERLDAKAVNYRSFGENIAMVPLVRSRLYESDSPQADFNCSEGFSFDFSEVPVSEREEHRQNVVVGLEELVREMDEVTWISNVYYDQEGVIVQAVQGWMESPGHRKNILTPQFNAGGVGIFRVNDYLIITHNLVGR